MFAVPRTPSVPKIRFGVVIAAWISILGGDNHFDFVRDNSRVTHTWWNDDFDAFSQAARGLDAGEIDLRPNVARLQFLEKLRLALNSYGDDFRIHFHIADPGRGEANEDWQVKKGL